MTAKISVAGAQTAVTQTAIAQTASPKRPASLQLRIRWLLICLEELSSWSRMFHSSWTVSQKTRDCFSLQTPVNSRQSLTTTQPSKLSFSRVEKESVGRQTTRSDRASIARHNCRTVSTTQPRGQRVYACTSFAHDESNHNDHSRALVSDV